MDKENMPAENLDVRMEIEAVRQQIAVMGANDTEFSSLDSIISAWEKRDISDSEAIAKAKQILADKQDYH